MLADPMSKAAFAETSEWPANAKTSAFLNVLGGSRRTLWMAYFSFSNTWRPMENIWARQLSVERAVLLYNSMLTLVGLSAFGMTNERDHHFATASCQTRVSDTPGPNCTPGNLANEAILMSPHFGILSWRKPRSRETTASLRSVQSGTKTVLDVWSLSLAKSSAY